MSYIDHLGGTIHGSRRRYVYKKYLTCVYERKYFRAWIWRLFGGPFAIVDTRTISRKSFLLYYLMKFIFYLLRTAEKEYPSNFKLTNNKYTLKCILLTFIVIVFGLILIGIGFFYRAAFLVCLIFKDRPFAGERITVGVLRGKL